MAKVAQGTKIYFVDPDTNAVTEIPKVNSLNLGGSPRSQLDQTALSESVRTYLPGLRDPGAASVSFFPDPATAAHVRVNELFNETGNTNVKFAVGWSDGTAAPTADSNGDFVWPEDSSGNHTRSWCSFEGYIADFPFDFSINSIVTAAASIQRSGDITWLRKGEAVA